MKKYFLQTGLICLASEYPPKTADYEKAVAGLKQQKVQLLANRNKPDHAVLKTPTCSTPNRNGSNRKVTALKP